MLWSQLASRFVGFPDGKIARAPGQIARAGTDPGVNLGESCTPVSRSRFAVPNAEDGVVFFAREELIRAADLTCWAMFDSGTWRFMHDIGGSGWWEGYSI